MNTTAELITKAKQLLPWSLPIKLALSAVLGVLGSAGLLGYLSEYATYSYAMYYGMRPPLEGIPYLKASVALASLFLLLSGAVVFVVTFFALRSVLWYVDAVPLLVYTAFRWFRVKHLSELPDISHLYGHAFTRLRQQSLRTVLLEAAFVGLLFAGSLYAAWTLNSQWTTKPLLTRLGIVAGMAMYGFVMTVVLMRPQSIWWVGGVFTLVYFVTWLVLLFIPTLYSEFLRVVGYGGGLPVSVEMKEESSKSSAPEVKYYLMLRTTDAFILLEPSGDRLVEIPREQVKRLIYSTGGIRRLPFILPTRQ